MRIMVIDFKMLHEDRVVFPGVNCSVGDPYQKWEFILKSSSQNENWCAEKIKNAFGDEADGERFEKYCMKIGYCSLVSIAVLVIHINSVT